MEAVCQNGSSSMLSNLNIKGGASVGDMELFVGMFLYLAAKTPLCLIIQSRAPLPVHLSGPVCLSE